MSALLVVPVAAPMLAAAATVGPGPLPVRRASAFAAMLSTLAVAVVMVVLTRDGDVVVARMGGWDAGVAIPFAADAFTALLLTVTAVVVLTALLYAALSGDDAARSFLPLVMLMTGGACGVYLTADLFTFFVFIEVMLAASYGLLLLSGTMTAVAALRVYLPVNLLASTVLLAGVGVVFGVTGSVQLGTLYGAGRESAAAAVGVGLIALALAVKAAVVPVHGWLPRSYPHAPAVVIALFSALLTKVGVYGLYRLHSVVLAGDPSYRDLVLIVAIAGMVLGVLGALGSMRGRDVLCHHMVSQVGYLLLGLGLLTPAAVAATVFFFVQYVLIKAALVLGIGAVESTGHSSRIGDRTAPRLHAPVLGVGFLVAALSLAGLPPLSGFVAKLQLARAAVAADSALVLVAIVAVSLLTLLSMLKLWNGLFWAAPSDAPPPSGTAPAPATSSTAVLDPPHTGVRLALAVPVLLLAAPSVLLGVGAEPVLQLTERAAEGLLDPSAYVIALQG